LVEPETAIPMEDYKMCHPRTETSPDPEPLSPVAATAAAALAAAAVSELELELIQSPYGTKAIVLGAHVVRKRP
jgi:hypothetical protein